MNDDLLTLGLFIVRNNRASGWHTTDPEIVTKRGAQYVQVTRAAQPLGWPETTFYGYKAPIDEADYPVECLAVSEKFDKVETVGVMEQVPSWGYWLIFYSVRDVRER